MQWFIKGWGTLYKVSLLLFIENPERNLPLRSKFDLVCWKYPHSMTSRYETLDYSFIHYHHIINFSFYRTFPPGCKWLPYWSYSFDFTHGSGHLCNAFQRTSIFFLHFISILISFLCFNLIFSSFLILTPTSNMSLLTNMNKLVRGSSDHLN